MQNFKKVGEKMLKYIGKRLLYMAGVFIVLSFLMYFIYNLIPGDPARAEVDALKQSGVKMTSEQYEAQYQAVRERLGLDKPLLERYVKWVTGLFQGDFGESSVYKTEVIKVIKDPLLNTALLNIIAVFLALLITIPLGIFCAVHKGSKFDQGVQVFTILGYSLPVFIISLVFIYLFAVKFRWFPVGGMNTPGMEFPNKWAFLKDRVYYMILPLLVMTFGSLGGMTRYVRRAMTDALSMDYIRTARAKGLREKVVIYSHAWRNALLPVITLIIGWFLSIFSGSVIVENSFSLNGLGKLYIDSLNQKDFQVVLALQMFYVIISLVGNLIIDLSYGIVDPRVRINK